MEIIVRRENLQRALLLVEKIAAKNATLPILGNTLLKVANGTLTFSATNLEIGVIVTVSAKVSSDWQVAVPARLLTDLIRTSRADTVVLKVTDNVLSVTMGSSQTSILCFDASEYPIIPTIKDGESFSLSAHDLYMLCASTIDAIATSESRPELAGALFGFRNKMTTIAATDSFRLVEHRTPTTNKKERLVIVPRNTIMELGRVLSGADGEVGVRIADNQILFTYEGVELVSRLIDGKFPDYQKVIPERFLAKTLIRREEFADAIRVASLFSSSISDVKLECEEKKMFVSGKHSGKGEGRASVEANLKGDPFSISLNYHYLLDGLKVIPTENVILQFTGKGSPFVMRPDDESSLVYLVMPLRG